MTNFLIDSNDLKYWSGQPGSKADLASVLSILIRTTSPKLTSTLIPKGISTYSGGWDGKVISEIVTEFVPAGVSLWEWGTQANPAAKAEKDWLKRIADPLGEDKINSTFVFVTTQPWKSKGDWINKKKAEKVWKNVIVLDSDLLVEWLGTAPVAAQKLAHLIGRKINGVLESLPDFWKAWSTGPKNISIKPSLLCAGRGIEGLRLKELLSGPPSIIPIRAATKEESVAYFSAWCLMQEDQLKETLFARTLLIADENEFKAQLLGSLPVLMPRFNQLNFLHSLELGIHHLIVPLGVNDVFESDLLIQLPKLGREETITGLMDQGLTGDQARVLAKETGRNISIIRRRLGFSGLSPEWAYHTSYEDLIPALLVGKWNEGKQGDRLILEYISGMPYDSYIRRLKKWSLHYDAPIANVGVFWRLVSPLDAWTYLGQYLTAKQLSLLGESFLVACGDIKPSLSLAPEKRYLAAFYGKVADYSTAIREGLSQSLVIIAVYGNNYQLPINLTPQVWVDGIINKLCSKPDEQLWQSLNDILPLIAEASPNGFLTNIERLLQNEPAVLQPVFEEAGSLITPGYYHTGLLWALEELAWMPDYLLRVSLTLIKLMKLDPGVKIHNKPVNSLHRVFQPEMPQTFASIPDCIRVLKTITEREPEVAWSLCFGLLPSRNFIGHENVKLRWRPLMEDVPQDYTDAQYYDLVLFLINNLLFLSGNNSGKIFALLERFEDLDKKGQGNLIKYVELHFKDIADPEQQILKGIRDILYEYHSEYHPLRYLPDELVTELKRVYQLLTPANVTESLLWVFNSHWPKFPEGMGKKEYGTQQEAFMKERRIKVLKAIYADNTFENFLSLLSKVKEAGIFGQTAAFLPLKAMERFQIAILCISDDKNQSFGARRFIFNYHVWKGLDKALIIFESIKKNGADNNLLIGFLCSLRSEYEVWNFVDTQNAEVANGYWKLCEANFWDKDKVHVDYEIQKLLGQNRVISAITVCVYDKDEQSTAIITELLEKLATVKSEEEQRLDPYHIKILLETLHERPDMDRGKVAKLEWLYAELLTGYNSVHKPKILFEELSLDPKLFIELISFIYAPENEDMLAVETEGLDPTFLTQRSEKARKFLNSWDVVPGHYISADNINLIDNQKLTTWVAEARRLAHEKYRLVKADVFIGKILAKFPEGAEIWPPMEIAAIIDHVNSREINLDFRVAITNKRSFSTRSPFAGGQRERGLAAYFKKLASHHLNSYPVTSAILMDIATNYEVMAKQEDNDALANDLEY